MQKNEVPKNLGIKIGSHLEVLWTSVATEAKALIKQSEDNLTIQKTFLKVAEEKIAEEKEKFK